MSLEDLYQRSLLRKVERFALKAVRIIGDTRYEKKLLPTAWFFPIYSLFPRHASGLPNWSEEVTIKWSRDVR